MLESHRARNPLATLAVQDRSTSRRLLFNANAELCGRQTDNERTELSGTSNGAVPLAFSGIHVISPRLLTMLTMLTGSGAFSIVDAYLTLAAQGEKILAFRADEFYWRDLGKPENVAQAAKDVQAGTLLP